jgi:hypothetical protein
MVETIFGPGRVVRAKPAERRGIVPAIGGVLPRSGARYIRKFQVEDGARSAAMKRGVAGRSLLSSDDRD